MKHDTSLPRRHLLGASLGTLAAAGLATFTRGASAQTAPLTAPRPLPTYVNWKDPASLIVHSSSTLETKRSAFGTSVITPAEQLYIRNNLPAPDPSILVNRDAWEVNIEGVKNPASSPLLNSNQWDLKRSRWSSSAQAMAEAFSRASLVVRLGQWVLLVVLCGVVCLYGLLSRRWVDWMERGHS